jgi:hypothetical protein
MAIKVADSFSERTTVSQIHLRWLSRLLGKAGDGRHNDFLLRGPPM